MNATAIQPAKLSSDADVPFCVDLNKTLVRTNTHVEMALSSVRSGFDWLKIPLWLLRGKAYCKRRLAEVSQLDVATLPYNEPLLASLHEMRAAGRRIVLCTAADQEVAREIAAHTRVFDEVLASDGEEHLAGPKKSSALERRFGKMGFDYAGNSRADIATWRIARKAYVANSSPMQLRLLAGRGVVVEGVYDKPRDSLLKTWARAVRVHQWAKNLLVFVPMVLGHRFEILPEIRAFFAFSFAASAGYLINDLLDLAADRKHPKKRNRPFAGGAISLEKGIAAVPVLLAASAAVTIGMPPLFAVSLVVYFFASLIYSLWLKRQAPIDVLMLAGLYALRVGAGGAAGNIPISPWTLAFSVFLFLSLALVKRVSELRVLKETTGAVPGRMYIKSDIEQLSSLGGAAGYISVLIMALYIHSSDVQVMYDDPHWLWLMLPILLHWITRLWLFTSRGWIHHDPLVFAMKDRTTYFCGFLILVVEALAL